MKIIKSFQGLRVIAMLFIFFFHFKIHGEGTFANIYNKFFEDGYFAVTFFFVLSGFLTFNKLKDKDISFSIKNSFKFMLNKMKKLYPLYAVMILVVFVVNVTPEKIFRWIILSIPSFLLLQSFVPLGAVYFSFNGVGWYISVLAFCYFISYFFMLKINSSKALKSIIIIYIFQCTCVFLGKNAKINQWLFYINPIYRSLDFLQGMLLASFINEHSNIKYKSTSFIEMMLVVVFLVQYLFISKYIPQAFKWGTFYLPIILLILAVFYYERGIISRFLGNKMFLEVAKFSFEFYIIHQFIISQCRVYLRLNEKLILILTIIITICISKVINMLSVRISKRNNKREIVNAG